MTKAKLFPALAFVAAGTIASGLALTSVSASAATGQRPATHAPAPPHARAPLGKELSKNGVADVRAHQAQVIAQHRAAPTFSKAGKTFTVNTNEDSDLANLTGTTCVDASTGKCSLRAAVDAANNLKKPVKIVLGAHTYTLSSATSLVVTNPQGTSIIGKGVGKTVVKGDGSGVFDVTTLSGASPGLLFASDLKVTGGSATYGGGFYVDSSTAGATVVLDHVNVAGNTATSYGGGLYSSDYNTVFAQNSTFNNNVAYEGGALYLEYADVNLTNTSLEGNHTTPGASGYGGAIYNDGAVLRIKGGTISGNTAGDDTHVGYGGAMYDEYGNVALTGVHVDDNTATDAGEGGAFYLYYDLVEINGGTMSHNHATGADSDGGAIYTYYGAQLGLHGVTMKGNRVGTPSEYNGGGALYLYAYDGYANQTTIDRGTTITGSNGSAIYAISYEADVDLSIDHSTLSGNHNPATNGMDSYGCGGAICLYSYYYGGTHLSMTSNKVMHNSAGGEYGSGAVSVYGYEYSGAVVDLRHNRFESNTGGLYAYGGALLFYNDDDYSPMSIRSQSNTFSKNKAGTSAGYGFGGALATYYYANFSDRGSTFSKNVAVGDGAYGGAVADESYQSSRYTGTKFTGNRAGSSTGGEGYGGAIYVEDEAGVDFTNVTMSGNNAASYGGGLYTEYGYGTSVTQSTISGNTAGTKGSAGFGGGIFAYDGSLVLENSTVANNTAKSISGTPGQGGGIATSDADSVGIRYSTVSGNVAKQGGGIYGYQYGGSFLSSIISGNHASKGGAEQDCAYSGAYAKLHSLGGNVLGQKGCVTATQTGDKISKHAKLGKLKDNGGPTKTMAISAKSPAVGRAEFQVPSSDQRGHGRPSKHADAGAFELGKVKKHH